MRANATAEIGAGHLVRCTAVAQAWAAAGGRAVFRIGTDVADAERAFALEHFTVRRAAEASGSAADIRETLREARSQPVAAVLLDGYDFGQDFHAAIKDAGLRLAVVDDLGFRAPCFADVLINANVHASREAYAPDPAGRTRWLLGPACAMLRPQFQSWLEGPPVRNPDARRLLVTLGGSDPDNVTCAILRGLRLPPESAVTVLVGVANPHAAAIQDAAATADFRVEVRGHVRDMASLMAETDLALSAAGSTALELAFMAVPMALVQIADNQAGIGEAFERHGAALHLGDAARLDPTRLNEAVSTLLNDAGRRQAMSAAGRRLVDGRGPERIVAALRACL